MWYLNKWIMYCNTVMKLGVFRGVVPHFHAVMLEPDVFRRHMRHKVAVVDQSPVIRKHKIRKIGKPVCM